MISVKQPLAFHDDSARGSKPSTSRRFSPLTRERCKLQFRMIQFSGRKARLGFLALFAVNVIGALGLCQSVSVLERPLYHLPNEPSKLSSDGREPVFRAYRRRGADSPCDKAIALKGAQLLRQDALGNLWCFGNGAEQVNSSEQFRVPEHAAVEYHQDKIRPSVTRAPNYGYDRVISANGIFDKID